MRRWAVIRFSLFTLIFLAFYALVRTLSNASLEYTHLEARYTLSRGETGIPGLSTWYEAHLLNHGKLPVHIQTCNFVDDVGSHGRVPAYAVERLDRGTGRWITVADASGTRACHPYPLGWVEAQLRSTWLWPGREVSTGEEITAARGFHKGDAARFVVYSAYRSPKEPAPKIFVTAPFTIDEETSDGGVGFRVKH